MTSWLSGTKVSCEDPVHVGSQTDHVDSDQNQLLYRNARQIKRIVEATYPSQSFGEDAAALGAEVTNCKPFDGGEKLACHWENVMRSLVYDSDGLRQNRLYEVSLPNITSLTDTL